MSNELIRQESIFDNIERFKNIREMLEPFASATIVPTHYQNNVGNCLVAYEHAKRLNVPVLAYMQNSYIYQGKPGMEAKFAIAIANESKIFTQEIDWEVKEDDKGIISCTAYTYLPPADEDSEKRKISFTLNRNTVVEAGWSARPLWKSQPALMYRYRSAWNLIKLYAPQSVMGLNEIEEIREEKDKNKYSKPVKENKDPEKAEAEVLENNSEAPDGYVNFEEIVQPDPAPQQEPEQVADVSEMMEKSEPQKLTDTQAKLVLNGNTMTRSDLIAGLQKNNINTNSFDRTFKGWVSAGKIFEKGEFVSEKPFEQPEQPAPLDIERPALPRSVRLHAEYILNSVFKGDPDKTIFWSQMVATSSVNMKDYSQDSLKEAVKYLHEDGQLKNVGGNDENPSYELL